MASSTITLKECIDFIANNQDSFQKEIREFYVSLALSRQSEEIEIALKNYLATKQLFHLNLLLAPGNLTLFHKLRANLNKAQSAKSA